MRLSLLLAAAPLVLLAGCATTATQTASTGGGGGSAIASPYGRFLAGEAALNEGRSADASKYFDQARVETDGDALVAERAFTAALLAGDVDKAAALAPTGDTDSEVAKRLGKLVVAVKDMADGKGKDAYALLAGDQIAFPHKAAAALLAPWAAAEAGDVENSIVRPEVRGDRIVDYFGQLGQALLFERAKRYGEAETDYKAIMGGPARTETAAIAYGGFLERRGRRAEAQAVYDASLAQEPSSVAVKAARARVVAGKAPPPQPTIRQGAALAMLTPAAIMTSAKQTQFALAYLRLALKLDPERDEAWVMLGDVMSGANDNDGARQAYGMVKPGSLEFATAQAKLAWTYQNAGDKETALKLARAAAATGDESGQLTLADLLRADEKFPESAEILTTLIHNSKTPDWRLLYARGVAYQRIGRWPEGEADLKAALAAQPDEPELLNYLGYSWIDRGEHLKEAMAMVEKAVGSDPRSGAMVDSLGWAYYRLGDYKKATEKLEEAVELDAGDPEINNHLGDAYWKVGRRDEAVFQWRRVLTLQPDDKIKADAERKIASNAGPDGPTQKLAEHEIPMAKAAFAPAKVNLFLHVGAPGADGYHPICSLMAFADIGDEVTAYEAEALELRVTGPFARALSGEGDNLVLRAARALIAAARRPVAPFGLTLTKRLPVAAGLGGGSSDAGAALRLLREALSVDLDDAGLEALAAGLGADAAACLWGAPVIAQGRGERLSPAPGLPVIDAVLVNPRVAVPTADVYRAFDVGGRFGDVDRPLAPEAFEDAADLAAWLAGQRNDLQGAAVAAAPAVGDVLETLGGEPECLLARVSGSGGTCFALCRSDYEAEGLAERIEALAPDWWVQRCRLGGPWPDPE